MIRPKIFGLLLSIIVLAFSLSIFAGCTPGSPEIVAPDPVADDKPMTAEIELKDRLVSMEVALTPEERARGLMGRASLDDDKGMLFIFPAGEPFPTEVSFWMKNCLMPIDVIFISREGLVTAIHEMQPPLPGTPDEELIRYPSNGPVQFAIELRGGLAAELGLQVGDLVELKSDYLLEFAE